MENIMTKVANSTTATDAFEAARAEHERKLFEERREIAQGTAANKRRVDLEEVAADHYQHLCDEAISDTDLTRAIATIAGAFYEPMDGYDDAEGNHIANAHHYQQKMALDNIVSNAMYMLKGALERRDALDKKLEALASEEESTGPVNTINNTLDMLERMEMQQIPNLVSYVQVVKAAYYGCRGEQWKPYVKQGATATTQDMKAARARLAEFRKARGRA